jgi:hypothetical protein
MIDSGAFFVKGPPWQSGDSSGAKAAWYTRRCRSPIPLDSVQKAPVGLREDGALRRKIAKLSLSGGFFCRPNGIAQSWEAKGDSHLLPERPFGCFAQKVTVTFCSESCKFI